MPSAKNKRSGDQWSSLLFILLSHLGEVIFFGEPQVAERVLDDKLGNGIDMRLQCHGTRKSFLGPFLMTALGAHTCTPDFKKKSAEVCEADIA